MELKQSSDYQLWISALKAQFRQTQLKAAVQVNSHLLEFYWHLGGDIIAKQAGSQWGDGFLLQLSKDLTEEFPDVKGFSRRNLELIRQWYRFWYPAIAKQPVSQLGQQTVAQLWQVPWGHNITIMAKSQSQQEALYYIQQTQEYGWSRAVLIHHMESQLWQREGKAVTNFAVTLPPPQSDLAQQTLKDPYVFDFLSLGKQHSERELENALTDHITQFLVELGAGFAYMGKQVHIEVGGQDFYMDLLFYHVKLRCYVVVELKSVDLTPEHVGKLNFYLSAVDSQIKTEADAPTIGLLLCKTRNKIIAEYSLRDTNKPIGVAEYQLAQAIPEDLEDKLPSIESIERELASELGEGNE